MSAAGIVRADVIVVGSGPNGLAAAVMCARAGRKVVVLEAQDTIGGGCRTLPMSDVAGDIPDDLADGLFVDPCSAVHPMAGASPFFRDFDLAAHGVELAVPAVQLGHALPGRDAIVVPSGPSPATLAEGLGSREEADRWWSVMGPLGRRAEDVVAAALSDQRSIPPVAATAALAGAFLRAHPRGGVADPLGPDGRRPLWTYAHVPAYSGRDQTEQVLAALEEVAPGVRDVVLATHCTPADRMAEHNANNAGGDIAAGRVDLRGLVARPVPRVDPFATPVPGVWHASGSTPPGPGVHGMAGRHVADRILGR